MKRAPVLGTGREQRVEPPEPTPAPASAGRRLGRWAAAVAAGLCVLIAGAIALAWFTSPSTSSILSLVPVRVRSDGGTAVALSDIAPTLRQAVVDTEDERFYRHHGVDLIGVARALVCDVGHASTTQGASTITAQLVKDLYLGGDDHSPWRKLEAAVMALRVENHLTKSQILDGYLNTVYFGHGAYGAEAAARRYFGVSAAALSPAQATLLAGLIQAPSADDPFAQPAAARQRQVEVIASMVRNGHMTPTQGDQVLSAPLLLVDGQRLPSVGHPALAPPSIFTPADLTVGVLALLAALGLWFLGRRRGWPLRWGLVAAGAATGVLLVARSFRVD
jgi:membrane peptidoglycan carboxypeptidase